MAISARNFAQDASLSRRVRSIDGGRMNLSDFNEVPSVFQQSDVSSRTPFDHAAASVVASHSDEPGAAVARSVASDSSLLDNFHIALHDEVCSMLSRACVQEGEPRTAALGKCAACN